jgi:hypothetical protein
MSMLPIVMVSDVYSLKTIMTPFKSARSLLVISRDRFIHVTSCIHAYHHRIASSSSTSNISHRAFTANGEESSSMGDCETRLEYAKKIMSNSSIVRHQL